jgi:hypothetical protein
MILTEAVLLTGEDKVRFSFLGIIGHWKIEAQIFPLKQGDCFS